MHAKYSMGWFAAALCVLALCGAHAAHAASPDNTCSLLTPAQVSAALGVPAAAGNNFGVAKACQWRQQGGADPLIVNFAIISPKAFDYGKSFAAMDQRIKVAPVSGIGDDAYYLTTGPITTLGVKKRDIAFKVYFQHGGHLTLEQIKAKEKTLALDVLAKL